MKIAAFFSSLAFGKTRHSTKHTCDTFRSYRRLSIGPATGHCCRRLCWCIERSHVLPNARCGLCCPLQSPWHGRRRDEGRHWQGLYCRSSVHGTREGLIIIGIRVSCIKSELYVLNSPIKKIIVLQMRAISGRTFIKQGTQGVNKRTLSRDLSESYLSKLN